MTDYINRKEALESIMCELCGTGCQSAAMCAIRRLPAADVAPVVHGRWKYHKYVGKYECMECGRFVRAGTDKNYCPNCGAKMDKEADDAK